VSNVRQALAGHPGIRDITIIGEGDLVAVIYAPPETSFAMQCQQVMDTVVLPGVRSFLGRFSPPQ
jgi:hypothetical protein